ncbi:unnamed protein product, partial [marine sediment metagenome]
MADQKEKATLIVTSAATARVYNDTPVISFKAHKEGETEERGYETWGKELVDLVKPEAKLNCEVTHIQRADDVIHRITQMFDNQGNAIRKTQRRASSPGSG